LENSPGDTGMNLDKWQNQRTSPPLSQRQQHVTTSPGEARYTICNKISPRQNLHYLGQHYLHYLGQYLVRCF